MRIMHSTKSSSAAMGPRIVLQLHCSAQDGITLNQAQLRGINIGFYKCMYTTQFHDVIVAMPLLGCLMPQSTSSATVLHQVASHTPACSNQTAVCINLKLRHTGSIWCFFAPEWASSFATPI